MATSYKLSYTATEIDEKLGMVDTLSTEKADASHTHDATEIAVDAKSMDEPMNYFNNGTLDEVLMNLDAAIYDLANQDYVSPSRKINGKYLSADITLSASDVGADASGTAAETVETHNTATDAHADIREEISQLSSQIVDEIAVMTKAEYATMTKDDLAELYAQGVRILAITENYTNLVPLSIDIDGSIYNDVGYMDGYRLNEDGEVVADISSNFTHTGFIPWVYDCTIRSKGSTYSSASGGGQYLTFYDSSFNCVAYSSMSTIVSNGYGSYVVQEDGYYLFTMDTSYGYESLKEQVAYFRVSHRQCNGADLIVTVNQEI